MFSGILAGAFQVKSVETAIAGMKLPALKLTVCLSDALMAGLTKGASIAINGVCLTVVDFDSADVSVSFDVIQETLRCSNLGQLRAGDFVNLERSIKYGSEIGGHLCSGHVDDLVTLSNLSSKPESTEMSFTLNRAELSKYIFEKGYVALNGASLTVAAIEPQGFKIALIPETISNTTFGKLKPGDKLNLEIDRSTQAIVDTVERLYKSSL